MQFEHGLLLDHDPGNPRIGHGEQEKEPDDRTGTEVQELDTEGESQEDAGREDINGPFESHGFLFMEIIYHLLPKSEVMFFYSVQLNQTMPHQMGLTSINPGCIIFLVDHSSEMRAVNPATNESFAFTAKDFVDHCLNEMRVMFVNRGEISPRVRVGVYGYSTQYSGGLKWIVKGKTNDNPGNQGLVCISELGEGFDEFYHEEREVFIEDMVEINAAGSRNLVNAVREIVPILENFVMSHINSFPPVVVHITGGNPPNLNIQIAQQILTEISGIDTSDGGALLQNVFIPNQLVDPLIFPTKEQLLSIHTSAWMVELSSRLPESMRHNYNFFGGAALPLTDETLMAVIASKPIPFLHKCLRYQTEPS